MAEKQITVDRLVAVFIKIRDKRSTLKKEYEAVDNELKEKLEIINAELMKHCEENNTNSVNTDNGTFYRKVRENYWSSDWASFHKFILEHGVPELLSNRIHQTNLKTFLEENPDVHPQGLNVNREYVVTVNKPRKKKL